MDADSPLLGLPDWVGALDEARRDADAGRTVPVDYVHNRFRNRLYDEFGRRRPVQKTAG